MEPLYRLTSGKLQIGVRPHGAELCSIRNKNGFEYLWQADPEIWPRHAPVLFPVVGRLRENRYELEGQYFPLNQHGFARDQAFSCRNHDPHELVFELRNSEITRKNYPFDFCLVIRYSLDGDTLFSHYEVENTGNTSLYFSIGAHPGFNLSSSEKIFKPKLTFETDQLQVTGLSEGLLNKERKTLLLQNKTLTLSPELFANDALVLEGAQVERVKLIVNAEGRGLEMNCKGWPYFGIWSKVIRENLQFVCLEPWHGVADSYEVKRPLPEKQGVLMLEPGNRFEAGIQIRFF